MRALALGGLAALTLVLAAPTAPATPAGPFEGPIEWVENWADAAAAAKEKSSVVFVYVHRTNPP